MKRRSRFWLNVFVIFGLLISANATVAQGAPPPELSHPRPGQASLLQHSEKGGIDQTVAAAGSLSQPGTSFRYVQTFGVTGEPYLADTTHINHPMGLFMDSSNNLFVVEEEQGYRVIKYNSTGQSQLTIGKAGMCETGDYTLCNPRDVALDNSGNIWVVDGNRIVQYSPIGAFLQQFPATEPWASGNDNTHFENPRSIAFDSTGLMFVSDTDNQRIQVFDISGGSPIYSTTIGETDVIGSTDDHFNSPYRIAVDNTNRLFVVDNGNNRVQRCTYSGGWNCTTIDNGLNKPRGITTDGSGNVYVADTENGRIRKCTSSGTCSDFVTGTSWLYDVAVDSFGNVYGAAAYECVVLKFNNSGVLTGTFVGTEFVPYLTDNYHYNHPRVAIDSSNNIIIVEENGQRLTKLNASGVAQWSVGVPGVDNNENDHFNYPHGVAVDQSGNIYVADGTRVQIYSGSGTYLATLGTGSGTGNYQFAWATGIAVDNNGNIYVADYPNHRVQIYNSNLVFVGRLGATGECSAANDRLCTPIAVDVDSAGNIYVTDAGNSRVQKFNSNRQWQMTIGGTSGDSFDQFNWAEDIAVDAQGKIYVSDWSNNRVQVFDSTGAYLTTIGGSWGTNSSQFTGVPGVDVDSYGNVYVADWINARIQKFALGVPGWQQANINGFGNPNNVHLPSLAVFGGYLYAGTANWNQNVFQIWRTPDGTSWAQAGSTDFGGGVSYLSVFKNTLYAGTWNGNVWSSPDGLTWTPVISGGFGGDSNNGIARFSVFNDTLYATTWNTTSGTQIWRTTDGNIWTQFGSSGLGDPNNAGAIASEIYGGQLYWGVGNWDGENGAQLWRTDGLTVTAIITNGFGDANNKAVWTLAAFNGNLYAGTSNANGIQVWRSSNGTQWSQAISGGLGNPLTNDRPGLEVFNNQLYLVAQNSTTGMEVWRTSNGTTWEQIGFAGFGDSKNEYAEGSGGVTPFKGSLYIAANNSANGGEVWQMMHQIYLPLVVR